MTARICGTCASHTEPLTREPCASCQPAHNYPNWTAKVEIVTGNPDQPNAHLRAMMDAMANGTGVIEKRIDPKAWFTGDEFVAMVAAKGLGTAPEAMATQGVKFDADKPRMDLLDAYALEQLSLVLAFGAKKYAAHNWRKGISKTRLIAAALRHLFAYLRGEDKDPETGLSHAAHAMCCCMFILGLEHRADLDDRFKDDAK